MVKNQKSAFVMAILGATTGLMGCTSSRTAHSQNANHIQAAEQQAIRRLDYAIEQNELGEFVFCKTGECLQPTPKIMAETAFVPDEKLPMAYFESNLDAMQSQYPATVQRGAGKKKKILSGSLKVPFALGSSRLGAGAVRNLNHSLPKLIRAETIQIRGWADSYGGKNTNINNYLALERAKKIRTWLVERKVPASKIKLQTKPACCNRDDTRQAAISWVDYR